ncbi:DUF1674 domain-containing protein [Oceanicola sp. S124]|uniref:DUF1674 domain-containing protein n=1 Tax=Oceanicola sp. S124 TaxID=1042378 RepID=UPI000255A70F|nr:DUF1674 domain-containing protein [Oceanicola sp. S124]
MTQIPEATPAQPESAVPSEAERRAALPAAAQRALAEAEERRRKLAEEAAAQPREYGGREGPDPARYGDWEKKGIAIDF